MDSNNRDSGITILGNIPWGTHIGLLYLSKADFIDFVVPYIYQGLINNELCIRIYADNTSLEEIKDNLGEWVEDVDSYLIRGQLMIVPHTQWYLKDNNFNGVRVNRQWNELIRHALDSGYDGLRAVGDTSFLQKNFSRDFEYYEQSVNNIISDLSFIAMCLYDVNKLDAMEIVQIIKNHRYVITKHKNQPYLIKNVEFVIKDEQLAKSEEIYGDIQKTKEMLNETLDKIETEFFSNISHELRTPLNVILSTVQLLKLKEAEGDLSIWDSKYLKTIQQNCFRLLRLINNLIDITKIDSGYFELRLQNYNIISLIENITMSIVDYARNKGINIFFDTNTEEKIMACDPAQIERVMLNLLSNAIKYTQRDGIIWVSVSDLGERIRIAIKDTGIGIPLDKQKCIFDRFKHVDSSFRRCYEGSGIGLSIVKALVEKHNGTITLNSQLGRGSEFIIEMPCTVLTAAQNQLSCFHDIDSQAHLEKIRIEFSDISL